ncbi:glyoxylase-like metal-dependent hydrolase (beta-lactamase superfamily II) [Agromyces flavus]|uniref:beta-lactamase n=1 Tax=Agromyces flavus TaxID=589382 RepID=A0ABT1KGP4_9MICO|nr:MBL fold metallo-hydrolase [Agromyces flavus]MCP2366052.1 glyoxylase-like metal-dependent hydrolase (beta-lactamase superfamily II) [Agromyces flavus]
MSEHLHFVHTPHVNWSIYAGPDGVTLIDAGYVGQRDLLVASLQIIGCRVEDVSAVLLTHGHADHLGGAAWLAATFGTRVYAHPLEVRNVRRDVVEQAGVADLVRQAWRPGVLRWALDILPLLDRNPALGVPDVAAIPMRDGEADVPGHPRVILVEGHTTGHTAFDFEGEGVLVVGDCLATRHGTSHLAGPQLLPSVFHHDLAGARETLGQLRGSSSRVVVPGHGEAWIGSVDAMVDAALRAGTAW